MRNTASRGRKMPFGILAGFGLGNGPDLYGSGVCLESFRARECRDGRCKTVERVFIQLLDGNHFQVIRDREPAAQACRSTCRQYVIGPGCIVARCLGTEWTDEYASCIPDLR